MKKLLLSGMLLGIVFSCHKKPEHFGEYEAHHSVALKEIDDNEAAVDSIVPLAATQKIEGKEFVRTAWVNIDAKDVYESVISIENHLKEMGGFVLKSEYRSIIESEKIHEISDEKSMLVRKHHTESEMQVKVPTEKLAQFLKELNDNSIFLHNRSISAEDVSANIKLAQMEKERILKNNKNLEQLKNSQDKIQAIDYNLRGKNILEYDRLKLVDNIKYSLVDIRIKEPKSKITQIEIPNTKKQENQYKVSFGYELKEAFVSGFYGFQMFLIFIANAWVFIILGILLIFIWKKRKSIFKFKK